MKINIGDLIYYYCEEHIFGIVLSIDPYENMILWCDADDIEPVSTYQLNRMRKQFLDIERKLK